MADPDMTISMRNLHSESKEISRQLALAVQNLNERNFSRAIAWMESAIARIRTLEYRSHG